MRFSPGFDRRGGGDIFGALLRRAALVNRGQPEVAGQAARRRPGVHPRQLERDQRQREIFRPGDKPALFRIEKRGGDAAFIEMRQQAAFFRRPLVGIAPAAGDQPRDRTARHAARGLREHLEVISVGEAPHDLADVVAGKGAEHRRSFLFKNCFHNNCFRGG